MPITFSEFKDLKPYKRTKDSLHSALLSNRKLLNKINFGVNSVDFGVFFGPAKEAVRNQWKSDIDVRWNDQLFLANMSQDFPVKENLKHITVIGMPCFRGVAELGTLKLFIPRWTSNGGLGLDPDEFLRKSDAEAKKAQAAAKAEKTEEKDVAIPPAYGANWIERFYPKYDKFVYAGTDVIPFGNIIPQNGIDMKLAFELFVEKVNKDLLLAQQKIIGACAI